MTHPHTVGVQARVVEGGDSIIGKGGASSVTVRDLFIYMSSWLVYIPSECKTESSSEGAAVSEGDRLLCVCDSFIDVISRGVSFIYTRVLDWFIYISSWSVMNDSFTYRSCVMYIYISSWLIHTYKFVRCVMYITMGSWPIHVYKFVRCVMYIHMGSWLIHIYKLVRCAIEIDVSS